jgi:hypothetical protein
MIKRYEKIVIRFTNELVPDETYEKIEDIPEKLLRFVLGAGIDPLIKILVVNYLKEGKSQNLVARMLGIQRTKVKSVAKRNGLGK